MYCLFMSVHYRASADNEGMKEDVKSKEPYREGQQSTLPDGRKNYS